MNKEKWKLEKKQGFNYYDFIFFDFDCCDLFDKNNNELPLKNFIFYQSQAYEGDSIVKKANSHFVYVYRKRNWRDYGSDDSYFVAEKINLN